MQSSRQDVGLVLGRYVRPRGHDHTVPLSFPPRIQWHVCGGEGGRMAVTVQMQFESVVTELYEDAFIGSSIENGTTIIQFDLRKLDFQRVLETTSTICWCKAPYAVEVHELSTFHNPIKYRFIVAQGAYLNDQHQRVYFTPGDQGRLDLPAYEPQRDPIGLLPRSRVRGQSQAHCAPFCRTVPDSYYQVVDQTLD